MHHRRLTIAAVATVLGLSALVACDGDAGGTEPDPDPSSSSTGTGSESPGASGSADPSQQDPPSVEPATGAVLRLDHVTMRAPTGYERMPDMLSWQRSASSSDASSVDVVNIAEKAWGVGGLDEAVALEKRADPGRHYQRLDDVELDGVAAFHLRGDVHLGSLDAFGAIRDGVVVTIKFDLGDRYSRAHRDRAIASSLATFQWR